MIPKALLLKLSDHLQFCVRSLVVHIFGHYGSKCVLHFPIQYPNLHWLVVEKRRQTRKLLPETHKNDSTSNNRMLWYLILGVAGLSFFILCFFFFSLVLFFYATQTPIISCFDAANNNTRMAYQILCRIYNIKGSFNLVRNQIHRKINETNSQMTIKIDRIHCNVYTKLL